HIFVSTTNLSNKMLKIMLKLIFLTNS
ncbi:uncharacterized protein METZ01_LOCUS485494, partial [marine metagenome]